MANPSDSSLALGPGAGQIVPVVAGAGAISCGVCTESSADKQWNSYKVFNKGLENELRLPSGDACSRCALGCTHGQFGAWADVKLRCATDIPFRQSVIRAGECALKLELRPQAYNEQHVTIDRSTGIYLKTYGKLLSDEDFRTTYGFYPMEVGLRPTTLPGPFGEQKGILVEDRSKAPKVVLLTSVKSVRLFSHPPCAHGPNVAERRLRRTFYGRFLRFRNM